MDFCPWKTLRRGNLYIQFKIHFNIWYIFASERPSCSKPTL